MTAVDPQSRDVLHAIERNDGTANTTEIRRETGLSNSSVRYRYDKLEDLGLIETSYDPNATPAGVAPLITAKLTETARQAIQEGLTVESANERADVEPSDNYELIRKLEQEVAQLRHLTNLLDNTKDDIIEAIGELGENQ